MISLSLLQKLDPELFAFFEKEMEHQHSSLSFIPDENSTTPVRHHHGQRARKVRR